MCLLMLAWQAAPRYRLAVAANRDEYHERPAQALAKWPEPPGIIAGRDLRASGTWLGVDPEPGDRKSTRLNSSHGYISYAVFCLKKKKKKHFMTLIQA